MRGGWGGGGSRLQETSEGQQVGQGQALCRNGEQNLPARHIILSGA